MAKLPPPLLIAGPTAVGKSAAALLLAERLGGEIISVDCMQVYCGLDIGTAKPSLTERQRVAHHLVDIVGLGETFNVAQFDMLARQKIAEVQARGRVPILCGGTGLYFKVLLEGIGPWGPPDAALRAELETMPLNDLLLELARSDPITYQRIDRKNHRRVIRALEIIRLTGRRLSTQRTQWRPAGLLSKAVSSAAGGSSPFIGLERFWEDLRQRIDTRVDRMFQDGLVAETQQLLPRGLERNRTAMQAIGYRQVIEFLRHEHSLSETVSLVKQRSRQFSRRQRTWFRNQLSLHWIQVAPEEPPETTAARLAELYLS